MGNLRNYLLILALIIGILIVGIFAMPKPNTPFVQANGQDLYLNGALYKSIGVNRYNLLTRHTDSGNIGCANTFSEDEIEDMFGQLQSLGVTTVRFWVFQSFTKSGEDMSRFNYVLDAADRHNIKVVPVFENHWADCTEGNVKSTSWYASGYQSPYGSYPLSLKAYIEKIVPQYKDRPTILAWEIMNEARDADADTLYAFTKDVSEYIKSLDSNHMVSIGMLGSHESTVDFKKINELASVDIVDYHDYYEDANPLPSKLRKAADDAKLLQKPLLVAESGIKENVPDRALHFQQKLQAFFDNGGDIYILWGYGESYVTNDGYNFDRNSPVAEVIKRTTDNLSNK